MTYAEKAYIETLERENDELRERIRQIEEQLGMGFVAPMAFDFTRTEEAVFGALLARDIATKEMARLAMYADAHRSEDEETDIKIVDVYICKLRKKLKRWDIEIKTAWGRGYYIDADTKAKVRSLLKPTALVAAE